METWGYIIESLLSKNGKREREKDKLIFLLFYKFIFLSTYTIISFVSLEFFRILHAAFFNMES